MTDVIWINTWNGAAWEGWTALPDGAIYDSPTVTVMDGVCAIGSISYGKGFMEDVFA